MNNPDSRGGEIAFFGGSFTAIDRDVMVGLLKSAYKYVENGSFKGIRCSTRPDAIDDEICRILKLYRVTAVELGAQSMSDEVLRLNRRGHTSQDVINASEMLKSYGFELGLQMMTGLYGSTDEDSIETAKKIIALKPATVRIYPTVVLENTELAKLYKSGKYQPETVDSAAELCAKLLLMFNEADITVIRTGLHSGGGVEGEYLAGAYHPAFRELCEGEIYLEKMLSELSRLPKDMPYVIEVPEKSIGKAKGQNKRNEKALLNDGFKCKIKGNEFLNDYDIKITEDI